MIQGYVQSPMSEKNVFAAGAIPGDDKSQGVSMGRVAAIGVIGNEYVKEINVHHVKHGYDVIQKNGWMLDGEECGMPKSSTNQELW